MEYENFTVTKVSPHIGGNVSGIDLTQSQGEDVYQEIRKALWDHQVLFFRDQPLTPESHHRLACGMGELETHEIFSHVDGYPELSVIENDKDRPPNINVWHTDVTFREKPSLASILHGVTVPQCGGDTLWLSQQAAYEGLTDRMKDIVSDLEAEHSGQKAYAGSKLLAKLGKERAASFNALTPTVHPVVVKHPFTGKPGLFVNPTFTTRLIGFSGHESRQILEALYEHMHKPEYQVRFQWQNDSVAIWDNVATQHYAVADYFPEFRSMRRIVISGVKPVAWQAVA